MPKKRKTRKEKLLHDQKRQVTPQVSPPLVVSQPKVTESEQETVTIGTTFSLPTAPDKTPTAPLKVKQTVETIAVSTNEYGYLGNDLMRTALLTGAIVFAELLIRLFFVH